MLLRFPIHNDSLTLTGSAVGPEGLTVAVLMYWTLAHVRHTGPGGKSERGINEKEAEDSRFTYSTVHTNARSERRGEIASVCHPYPVHKQRVEEVRVDIIPGSVSFAIK